MKNVKRLGAPRRGVVWTRSPAAAEFPDASDYDNNYAAESARANATESTPRRPAPPHDGLASLGDFLHARLTVFRHVVLG